MRSYMHDPNRVKCFFIEPTNDYEVEVYRSSSFSSKVECLDSSYGGGHFAEAPVGIYSFAEQPTGGYVSKADAESKYGLSAYPTHCKCGYQFTDADGFNHRFMRLYQRRDDPTQRYTLQNAPVGAMYYATWYEKYKRLCGPDGKSLVVVAPGKHDWFIDNRASNCTMPNDEVHKCWCRHGDPLTGNVTVDKNGHTCAAGAGSLLIPGWHGFLTDGYLHT